MYDVGSHHHMPYAVATWSATRLSRSAHACCVVQALTPPRFYSSPEQTTQTLALERCFEQQC